MSYLSLDIARISLALSDSIRLQVLDLLVAGRNESCCSPCNPNQPSAICACDLQERLSLTASKLSYHMKELREAGLIGEQKRGRWVYYSIDPEGLNAYLSALSRRFYATQPASECCPTAMDCCSGLNSDSNGAADENLCCDQERRSVGE